MNFEIYLIRKMKGHVFKIIACAVFILFVSSASFAHVKIEEVTSLGGIKAWLVRDEKVPVVSVKLAFRGGAEQDPWDKQGLTAMMAELLTQGAGNYDSEAFQRKLADNSIQLEFSAGRDFVKGSLKSLSSKRDEAFSLLGLAITKPRFDAEAIERIKTQQKTLIRLELGKAGWQARYALFSHIFAGHPYSMRRLGTEESVDRINAEDLRFSAKNILARDNLYIAVVGDITAKELSRRLDEVFGNLPAKANISPLRTVSWPKESEKILIERDGTQTDMFFSAPMMFRNDLDWYAAEIANYILGGGGFSSRLMRKLRDEKGLTYGVGTTLAPMDYASIIIGQASTDNAKAGQAWEKILETWQELFEEGVSEEEIESAKNYLIGSLPLGLTNTESIASALLQMQTENLGKDYLEKYPELIRKVSQRDIERVIKLWFDPSKINAVFAGKPKDIVFTKKQEAAVK